MKKPLVLIPGMMCDGRLFAAQIKALAPYADMHVGDISGSDTMSGIGSRILETCPFDRFHVAGLSMGGITAMELARQASGRVAGIALLDTNHLAETAERRALRQGQIDKALGGQLREMLIEEMKPSYLAPHNRRNTALLDAVLEMGLSLGPQVFRRQSLALRDRPDYSETLKAFAGPALVLCGGHDILCPVSRHQEIAGLMPQSNLVVIVDSGHLTTMESPTAVNEALISWLLEDRK